MEFLDKITGRGAEKKLDEYSEIYGEVLLGMHRDLQDYLRKIDTLAVRVDRLRRNVILGAIAVLIVNGAVMSWILHFKR
jgi:hypothetical protein